MGSRHGRVLNRRRVWLPALPGALALGLAAGWALRDGPAPPAPLTAGAMTGAPTPAGTNSMALATPPPGPDLPGVPAAAWRRAVGAPLADPGVNKVQGPGNGDDGPWQGAPVGG